MKAIIGNSDRTSTLDDQEPTLAIIKHLPLSRIKPVFDDCSLEELQYFLERAIQQQEFELCSRLRDLIEMRYTMCVA